MSSDPKPSSGAIALLQRVFLADRGSGLSAMLVGVTLIASGVVGATLAESKALWQVMLVVIGVGMIYLGLGIGVSLTSRARPTEAPRPRVATPMARDPLAALAGQHSLPFWVCSECRVIEAGISERARCQHCERSTGFVQVTTEDRRSVAVACMW